MLSVAFNAALVAGSFVIGIHIARGDDAIVSVIIEYQARIIGQHLRKGSFQYRPEGIADGDISESGIGLGRITEEAFTAGAHGDSLSYMNDILFEINIIR